ncbi:hypothetical protein [Gorillibacterium timonense]|uniref:hypothetical protein n=1 Tax=Gorillibacterium timonense TaxID=1689269 RepID=UPI00071E582C|nr:hypothetical protein [Gorillibacterium timonense]
MAKTQLDKTSFLLDRYSLMMRCIEDFETHSADLQKAIVEGEAARRISQDDMYADKTANAVILMDKQRWIYSEYRLVTMHIARAIGLVMDDDARKILDHRYLRGKTAKEVVLFFSGSMSKSTVERKMREGKSAVASTLKQWEILDRPWDLYS